MRYAGRHDVLVLALPRGGAPVAFEIARALGAPLDVITVRKLGFPGNPEVAMGAIASGGICVLNEELVVENGVPEEILTRVAAREARETARREYEYRGSAPPIDPRGRTVILVDDGLATGATMRAAIESVRAHRPARVVVAVPVAAVESCSELGDIADEIVCAMTPSPFRAVGRWYEDFEQVTDRQVCALLAAAR